MDTRTSSQIAKKILPAKLHLIPAAVILIPLFFPQVRTYLLTESDGRVMLLCTILVAAAYMGTGYLFAHMPNKIYSENSQINLQINALEMGIYIFLELIPAAIILIMFFWLRKEKERILSQDSTPFYIDDDYYWRKGWYNNPNDKRYFVQDRVNSMNYSLNYGHPSAKYVTGGMLVGTGLLLLWMCILCIRIDFTPIRLTENAAQYSITSGYKTATFALADVESVTLLDNLPDEKFYRSDGSEDNSKLLGNFRGSKTGHCQMYIWIEHPPVLQIKTTDTTIFLNSSSEAQTKEWYDQLNDAISSNK